MKYFRMSYDEIVFKRSYLTLQLLNASIPSVKPYNDSEDDDSEIEDDDIDAIAKKQQNENNKAKTYKSQAMRDAAAADKMFMSMM